MLSSKLGMTFSRLKLQHEGRTAPRTNVSTRNLKVAVVGASGGIGQPLSLLLKMNPLIETLAIHDVANTMGVGADLSHICTRATVKPYNGADKLEAALKGADIVVVPAGMPRKPGMTRNDLLDANASVAAKVALAISAACPGALLAFITNPVNTIVPIVAEFLKSKEVYDPKRLFGVTALDIVRAKTFIAESMGVEVESVRIPVIGGHAGTTILPIFSQCSPGFDGDDQTRKELTHRIQEAGTEVVKAKAGLGSATLSMAYAAAGFVDSLLRALSGEEDIIECAYVQSQVSDAEFFATPLLLGPTGIKKNLGMPELDDEERDAVNSLVPVLIKNIEAGVKYASDYI